MRSPFGMESCLVDVREKGEEREGRRARREEKGRRAKVSFELSVLARLRLDLQSSRKSKTDMFQVKNLILRKSLPPAIFCCSKARSSTRSCPVVELTFCLLFGGDALEGAAAVEGRGSEGPREKGWWFGNPRGEGLGFWEECEVGKSV